MHLKLKRRELRITLYDGEVLEMKYPTKREHDEYVEALLETPEKDDELSRKFFLGLGMSEDIFDELQKPDLIEICQILTGQKKI